MHLNIKEYNAYLGERFFIIKFFILFISFVELGMAQDTTEASLKKYREDQFYVGVVYNLLVGVPNGISQNNFSYGISSGFIRDFPINDACNKAIGLGIGYATNSYYTNLVGMSMGSEFLYLSIPKQATAGDYSGNKLETHIIEVPIEFRFRTSTYDSNSFWRLYLGFKTGYVFENRSRLFFTNGDAVKFFDPNLNRFRYSLYLAFNFKGKWNVFVDFDLNPIFDPTKAFMNTEDANNPRIYTSQPLNMRGIRVGVRFYIL